MINRKKSLNQDVFLSFSSHKIHLLARLEPFILTDFSTLHILHAVKSLLLGYPFQAMSPCFGHYREFASPSGKPNPPLGEYRLWPCTVLPIMAYFFRLSFFLSLFLVLFFAVLIVVRSPLLLFCFVCCFVFFFIFSFPCCLFFFSSYFCLTASQGSVIDIP